MEEVIGFYTIYNYFMDKLQLSNSQTLEAQSRNKSVVDRKKALDIEKNRARRIAAMPVPQSHDFIMVCLNETL